MFFLHLLGIDTAGHASRPYSDKYLRNIQHVDAGVKKIHKLVNDFYKDDKTAWIFTADHGMSDWGSHGDGHPNNTRTPLIAWGAGIAKPNKEMLSGHDEYSKPWNLSHIKRVDVEQADIASLMSYLVGLNYPANSVGELPLDYVDASLSAKSNSLLQNALEILEQYRVKELQTKQTKLNYKPFSLFENNKAHSLDSLIADVHALHQDGKFEDAIKKSKSLIQDGLQGLRYLQTYVF